ncbi:hypothetical protein LCGC14_1731800 [marine sediment metagenome]|uniref:Uncharacterized protein n=1 Tax=marine sediment metagenome TaxID=412755 RepID=A0A0F9H9A4_9ZZZZ
MTPPTFINGIDSIEREIVRHDTHFHTREIWLGAAAVPAGETHVADVDSMVAFVADAGNDDWGTWLQVIGSTDTPVDAGMVWYDAHRIAITTVEQANTETRVQIGFGATGAAALTAGTYTEIIFRVPANARNIPIDERIKRAVSGDKAWVRVWADGAASGEVRFFLGIHEYPF